MAAYGLTAIIGGLLPAPQPVNAQGGYYVNPKIINIPTGNYTLELLNASNGATVRRSPTTYAKEFIWASYPNVPAGSYRVRLSKQGGPTRTWGSFTVKANTWVTYNW
jgi:hypothetical protein